MSKKISTRDTATIAKHIARGLPFETHGALSMVESTDGELRIYSYRQPIAVVTLDPPGYSLNPQKYSVTTSRYQGTVRRALEIALPDATVSEIPDEVWEHPSMWTRCF